MRSAPSGIQRQEQLQAFLHFDDRYSGYGRCVNQTFSVTCEATNLKSIVVAFSKILARK